jgi:hypothetical protein
LSLHSETKVKDLKQTGTLGARAAGKRAIKLRKEERETLLFREKVEKAVLMFLDLHTDRTWVEIARELDMSVPALHDLTKSDEFNEIYNEYFAELGHDPRIKVSQQALADMVPVAIRTLKEIISDPEATTSARLKAVEMVFRMAGVERIQPRESDKSELQSFLLGKGVNIEQVNIALPPALRRAEQLLASPPPVVVEGAVVEQTAQDPDDELDT